MQDIEKLEELVVKETPDSFFRKVDDLVWEKDISYIDAAMKIALELNIEPESIKKLINKELYAMMEIEAEKLSLLKEKKRRLPV